MSIYSEGYIRHTSQHASRTYLPQAHTVPYRGAYARQYDRGIDIDSNSKGKGKGKG